MSVKAKPKVGPKAQDRQAGKQVVGTKAVSSKPIAFDDLRDLLAAHLIRKSKNRAKDIAAVRQLLRQIASGRTPKASPKRAVRPTQGRKTSMGKEASKSGPAVTVERPLSAGLKSLLASVLDQPEKWMATPNRQFGDRKPSELVGTADETRIFDLLHAVDQGLF
jgi:hypothetical protein